mmetsp:Transcript_6245/g.16285  ORF Transcript_6245/g.16285 Transcript_6245/m.16285 type:complete len:214 (+) Transcript_6245:66-707(+)
MPFGTMTVRVVLEHSLSPASLSRDPRPTRVCALGSPHTHELIGPVQSASHCSCTSAQTNGSRRARLLSHLHGTLNVDRHAGTLTRTRRASAPSRARLLRSQGTRGAAGWPRRPAAVRTGCGRRSGCRRLRGRSGSSSRRGRCASRCTAQPSGGRAGCSSSSPTCPRASSPSRRARSCSPLGRRWSGRAASRAAECSRGRSCAAPQSRSRLVCS